MDRGPWWAAVHGVAKSRAQLSDYHTTHDALWRHKYLLAPSVGEGNGTPIQYSCLENPMDIEPGGLQSVRLLRVGHD